MDPTSGEFHWSFPQFIGLMLNPLLCQLHDPNHIKPENMPFHYLIPAQNIHHLLSFSHEFAKQENTI